MRTTILAIAAAATVAAAPPLLAERATANPAQLAQADVDVRVGPPGARIEEHRRPGAVIEEHRRPGVVIEETEGRKDRDCVTHSESTSRNGTTVTRKERDCAR